MVSFFLLLLFLLSAMKPFLRGHWFIAKSGHGQTAGGGGKQASIEARKKKTKTKQRRSSGGNDLCLSSSICGESIFHNRIAANRNKKKLPIVSTR